MNSWLVSYKQMLTQQISSGVLPHALLITGANGAGKQQLAHWLTGLLICQSPQLENDIANACECCKTCLLKERDTYPDYLAVTPTKSTIGVDNIRRVSQFFQKTAQIGTTKTALVAQADLMTVSAANALLKTLEEPTENSFIILTTTKAENVLPTIISRCRLLDIRPPIGEQLTRGFTVNGGNAFSNITHMTELSDESEMLLFKQVKSAFLSYLAGETNRLELLLLLTEHTTAFRWLENILCDQVRHYNQWFAKHTATPIKQVSQQCLLAMYQKVLSSHKTVLELPQANSRFIIEKLLIDIDMMRVSKDQVGN